MVAEPASVPIVTTVGVVRVLSPCNVAVTVIDAGRRVVFTQAVWDSRSARGPVGASSSSVIVVVMDFAVLPRLGAGPPPPAGLEIETVNVSPVPSSNVSSVVLHREGLRPRRRSA